MDGPHDLGGKDGYGPIDVAAPPFRADWERRQWAL
ncbi:MAG: nitrile hydratase subunit beta, partial [Pseudomonadota bacterium]